MSTALVKWFLAAIFFSLLFPSSHAQQQGSPAFPNKKIKLQNISIDDGLSQGYVSRVLQDETGYLWIATADGLNRYDGYDFVVYRNGLDSQSIASNYIKKMYLDRLGRLWITFAEGGLDMLDKVSGKFIHVIPIGSRPVTTDPDGFSFLGRYRNGVAIVQNRKFYSVDVDALSTGDKKGRQSVSFKSRIQPLIARKNSDHPLWGIMPDIYTSANGRIWVLDVSSSLYELKIDTLSNQYRFVEHSIPTGLVPANTPKECRHFFAVDEFNGLVYFQQYNNLYRLNEKTGAIELFMLRTGLWTFLYCAVDHHGDIWFSNSGKLYFIDVSVRKGWFVESADQDIEKKNVSTGGACYLDHTGNIWVCTLGYGLMKINLRNASFHHVKREQGINFSSKKIYTTARGDLMVTPWEGEDCYFDTIQKKLVPSKVQFRDRGPEKNGRPVSFYPFEPGSKIPAGILQNGNYSLRPWRNSYLCLIEPDKNFAAILYKEQQIIYECPHLLAPGHQVWFVAENKFLRSLNLLSGGYLNVRLPAEAGLARETIGRDKAGNIWLAAEKGICVYNGTSGKWRTYLHRVQGGLLPGNILCFFFSANDPNHAWIGFEGKGFCKLDINSGTCRYFTTDNGLPNNVVYGILQDKSGSLWMSTNRGLSSYHVRSNQFRNYTFEDGLQSNEFNRYCFAQSPSGAMLFGGVNGVNYFNAADITSRKSETSVWLTDMFVNSKVVAPWSDDPHLRFSLLDRKVKVNLNHDENMIAFRFALSDLTNPQQNQFRYKLEGIDQDWSRMSTDHDAVYTYLPPGDYVFRVKGINRDGIGAGNEISFPFSIATPWWQTWWFRTMLVLIVVATVYGLYRYRLNQVLRLQAIRNRISADMHDEIGSTLSSISFYSQALLMQNPDDKQRTVLEKIKANAQDVQEGLSDIVWSVKADMDSFENLLIRMQRIGNELLEPKNILFHFDADPKLKHLKIDMMTRKNFYLIFKEALHNAAKYAQCQNVWIHIQSSGQKVVMTIRDDGKGFDMGTKSNGNGLDNMQQRAVSIKGDMSIHSSPGNGTELVLSVKTPHE